MDFFGQLGINMGLIVGIIGISEYLKTFDKAGKLKKFYVFLPIIISCGASFAVTSPLIWHVYAANCLIYAGVSSLAYNMVKNTVLAKTTAASQPVVTPVAPVVTPAVTPVVTPVSSPSVNPSVSTGQGA